MANPKWRCLIILDFFYIWSIVHIRELQLLTENLILKSSSDVISCVGPWHTIQKAITHESWFCSDWCGKLPDLTVPGSWSFGLLTLVFWVILEYVPSRVESYLFSQLGVLHKQSKQKLLFICSEWIVWSMHRSMPFGINNTFQSSWNRLGTSSY